jgi:hypothetical protein
LVDNVVGAAVYGEVLHNAIAHADWWVLPGSRFILHADAQPIAEDDGSHLPHDIVFHALSQRNSKWANVVLGNSHDPKVTIGQFGSWLVIATILANAVHEFVLDPVQMNLQHKQYGGFYASGVWGGLVKSYGIESQTQGRVRLKRIMHRATDVASKAMLDELYAHLQLHQPAVIEVQRRPEIVSHRTGNDQVYRTVISKSAHTWSAMPAPHFVLAHGYGHERQTNITQTLRERKPEPLLLRDGEYPNLQILDPFDGQFKTLCPAYGKTVEETVVRILFYELLPRQKTTSKLVENNALQVNDSVEETSFADGTPTRPKRPLSKSVMPFEPARNEAIVTSPAQNDAVTIWAHIPDHTHLPKPPPLMMGVNVLDNAQAAVQAVKQGYKLIACKDDIALARRLANNHISVLYRRTLPEQTPPPVRYVRELGGDCPGVIYLGADGNDLTDGSVSGIFMRAEFDIETARLVCQKSNGRARYAAGGFMNGQLNFDDPAICNALHDAYAEAYNTGLVMFNVQIVLPSWEGANSLWHDATLRQTARNWEYLFVRCGFDPRVRGIVCDRATLQTTHGGFYGSGVTNEGMGSFCMRWREVQKRPLVIDNNADKWISANHIPESYFEGRWHSPFVGAAFYQLGNDHTDALKRTNVAHYLKEMMP